MIINMTELGIIRYINCMESIDYTNNMESMDVDSVPIGNINASTTSMRRFFIYKAVLAMIKDAKLPSNCLREVLSGGHPNAVPLYGTILNGTALGSAILECRYDDVLKILSDPELIKKDLGSLVEYPIQIVTRYDDLATALITCMSLTVSLGSCDILRCIEICGVTHLIGTTRILLESKYLSEPPSSLEYLRSVMDSPDSSEICSTIIENAQNEVITYKHRIMRETFYEVSRRMLPDRSNDMQIIKVMGLLGYHMNVSEYTTVRDLAKSDETYINIDNLLCEKCIRGTYMHYMNAAVMELASIEYTYRFRKALRSSNGSKACEAMSIRNGLYTAKVMRYMTKEITKMHIKDNIDIMGSTSMVWDVIRSSQECTNLMLTIIKEAEEYLAMTMSLSLIKHYVNADETFQPIIHYVRHHSDDHITIMKIYTMISKIIRYNYEDHRSNMCRYMILEAMANNCTSIDVVDEEEMRYVMSLVLLIINEREKGKENNEK